MSHISLFDAYVREEATPKPSAVSRNLVDFYSTKNVRATTKSFTALATPLAKKLEFAPDLVAGVEEEENVKGIAEVCGKQWRVLWCSPLLNYHKVIRKGYEELERMLTGFLITVGEGRTTGAPKCRIETIKGLRGQCEDAECLSIKAEAKGWHCRVLMTSVYAEELQVKYCDFTQLPCLLVDGNRKLSDNIVSFLEKRFDCVIGPLYLSEEDLKWMSALWCGIPPTDDNHNDDRESARLRYSVIDENLVGRGLDHIDITMPAKQMRELQRRFLDPTESEMTRREMECFHEEIMCHLRRTVKLNLGNGKFTLTGITLPVLSASCHGMVRIERCEKVKSVLQFLVELCQGTTLTATPRLAVEEDFTTELSPLE